MEGWVEQHEPEGRYRVKFPTAPQTQTEKQQTPAGPVDVKVYISGGPAGAFVSAHQAVPADRGGLTDDQVMDQVAEAAKAQVGGVGANMTSNHGITYQGFPGRELVLTMHGKGGAAVMRLILAKERIVMVMAAGDNVTADSPRVKQFFESLKIE